MYLFYLNQTMPHLLPEYQRMATEVNDHKFTLTSHAQGSRWGIGAMSWNAINQRTKDRQKVSVDIIEFLRSEIIFKVIRYKHYLNINPGVLVWRAFYLTGHSHAHLQGVHRGVSRHWQPEECTKCVWMCQLGWQLPCWQARLWILQFQTVAVRSRVAGSRAVWETGKEGELLWLTCKHCATLRVFVVWLYGVFLFSLALPTIHLVTAPLKETVASGGGERRRAT